MKKVMNELKGNAIQARDGPIGSVHDVYFDDERWAVRYLVVDTGGWLSGRKVLISPASLPAQGGGRDYIRVDLTREQVENAPDTSADPPISRLQEAAHASYYGYPYYWAGPYLWGFGMLPAASRAADTGTPRAQAEAQQLAAERARDSHVRSSAEVVGYAIRAQDGEIGHVEDFAVDEETWAIREIVVDTRNWLPGKKVAIPPDAISSVDWANREVRVRLTRDEVKGARAA